ncbi:NAD(P)/FAD-dependent oxidoreductase [Nocardia inohanensis]|uniref:NAD(P)/FAD-dependent oxidoreductase n=1 Tax=Nocardia inohanensis TaxID=209246 RepID=UPI0008337017|nr:FAD-dependent oxidoreductase [Nocardia inohanensis]
MSGRIVIVGAGVAGATAARTLRTEGYTGEIVLLGAEPGLPYRRPMVSKELLAGTATAGRMLLQTADFWHAHGVEVRAGTAVERIDAAASRVALSDGGGMAYDSLLIATGARPRTLSLLNRAQPEFATAPSPFGVRGEQGTSGVVCTLRSAADATALRAALHADASLLIVGAGLIGCEVAATARALGARVTVLDAAARPLDRVAPALVGEFYRNLHLRNGVELHSDVVLTGFTEHPQVDRGHAAAVTSADGRTWAADLALVAIGSTPDTALAEAAGLDVSDGIRVDEDFRTSVPGIFAAGDVAARFDPELGVHQREEHWNSAQAQGAAAARSMLGLAAGPVEVPWGWSMQYGVNLQFAGRVRAKDELLLRGSVGDGKFMVLAVRAGRVAGAVAVGCPGEFRAAREMIAARSAPAAGDVPLGQLVS